MNLLPHVAAHLFGVPLAIHRPKLDVILSVLGSRVGLAGLPAPPGIGPPARDSPQAEGIAVIPVYGTLLRRTLGLQAESGLASYTAIAQQLDAALASPDVAAILLDVDSPGGEAGGVFDLADRIRNASRIKPVWAVANDQALSAAYALASAADRVFVSRTSAAGSIGVIAMHVDQSAKDMAEGLRYTAVFAGDRKNDLNPHQPLSDAAQAQLQAEVDRVYGLFVETVAAHRGLSADAVRATQASLFHGADAVAAGLADELGTFGDALGALADHVRPSPSPSALPSLPSLTPMTQALPAPVANAPAPAPVAAPTPPLLSAADAVEVAQICQLAGRPDLTASFLLANANPAAVRAQLLAAQAEASPEIASRIAPAPMAHGGAHGLPAGNVNAVIEATQALIARSATKGVR